MLILIHVPRLILKLLGPKAIVDTILHQIVVLYRLMVVSHVQHQDLIYYPAVQELIQLPIVISIMIKINAFSLVVLLM